jgi:hypothetical protein
VNKLDVSWDGIMFGETGWDMGDAGCKSGFDQIQRLVRNGE